MESNSEEKLRKELEAERKIYRWRCEYPINMARVRASRNRKRVVILFFSGVGLVFLFLLFK